MSEQAAVLAKTADAGTRASARAQARLDQACVDAVDLARSAAEQTADGEAGIYLGPVADEQRVVTHRFGCLAAGYRGWMWAVTIARAARAKSVTVDEVVLLPGADALVAPQWVPWQERVRPGDLGPGDVLPTPPDDSRLVPAAFSVPPEGEAADLEAASLAFGTGRPRVLSAEGRESAARRWHRGEAGPRAAVARGAPGRCGSCGFFVPLSGGLRQVYGACANELAPDDGRVVAADHGCGAHSEATVGADDRYLAAPRLDEAGVDVVAVTAPGSVGDADAAEESGHS
jgi:hypothetical protein